MLRRDKLKSVSILVLSMALLFSCTPKSTSGTTMIISFLGTVEIKRGDAPQAVVVGAELKEGDIIKTGPASFLVFQIGDTATARVQADSEVKLENIADPSKISMNLVQGGILNKVNKLTKDSSYNINTPTVVASVRGTVFSAYYDKGTNTVAVKNGNVDVKVKEKTESVSIKDGNAVVYTDKLTERPIDEKENIILENMVEIPPAVEGKDKAEADKINQQIIEKDAEINKKLEVKDIPKTLEEIKEQYQRIDEVLLYSGKIIKGVIVDRGSSYKILTPNGYVVIPAKDVRNTKVIK